jgi:glycosyltransferase involved in cell wall biosynthesis
MEIAENALNRPPGVSVVIASIVGPPFIDECLDSLESQAKGLSAEVIVVACGAAEFAARIASDFPWVRVIHRAERETVPDLRRHGVEAASGDLIAIIEEHCVAAPDWLEQAVQARMSGDFGVVGGPVAPSAYARLRDWVVYFCEYNNYLPPWQEGGAHDLGSANIAYSRAVLLKYKDRLGVGYWEAGLHPLLWTDGVKFHAAADMVVYHRGPFNYGYYLQQRYWFSRAFAGARRLPLSRRAAYLLASPLVPLLLLARMALRVSRAHCHLDKFILSLPLLIPVLLVYVAGEFVGYLAGPGDALKKVE